APWPRVALRYPPLHLCRPRDIGVVLFFTSATRTAEIYALSLHDALPISDHAVAGEPGHAVGGRQRAGNRHAKPLEVVGGVLPRQDRKSTRLNSSHSQTSYAVFCLKKKTGRRCRCRSRWRSRSSGMGIAWL